MPKMVEFEENVDTKTQLEEDVGVVILLNKFVVKPGDRVQFLKVFEKTTKFKKAQPGFLSQPNFIMACWEPYIL